MKDYEETKQELKKDLLPYADLIAKDRDLAEQLSRALHEGAKRESDGITLSLSSRSNFIPDLCKFLANYDYTDFYMIGDGPTKRGYDLLKKVGWN